MSTRLRTPDEYRPYIDLVDRVAVLAAEDPITYRRIRLHLPRVQDWFATRAGWSVIANREVVRLIKTPPQITATLGLQAVQQPLDYELITWVLWFEERNDVDQFLLTELVDEIALQANTAVAAGHIDWTSYPQRQSLRRALAALEAIGALRRVEGGAEEWAQDRTGNSLYEFTPLAAHLGVETLEGRSAAIAPDVVRLYRALLLMPVMYATEDPAAFALLDSRDRRKAIAEDFQTHFGWDLEVTDVHAALLRPAASEASEQNLFPFRAAIGHPVLLLCAALKDSVTAGTIIPDAHERLTVSFEFIEAELARLSEAYSTNWGATIKQLALPRLTQQVVELMRDWQMLHGPTEDGLYRILPAAARFSARYVEQSEALP